MKMKKQNERERKAEEGEKKVYELASCWREKGEGCHANCFEWESESGTMLLTKSAMLATWMASWTTSARVLPFLLSNIALSMIMAVSIYLVASRTSLLYLPAPFASWWSTKPVKCCCLRPPMRLSRLTGFAQPLFCFVFASKITWGCFC